MEAHEKLERSRKQPSMTGGINKQIALMICVPSAVVSCVFRDARPERQHGSIS